MPYSSGFQSFNTLGPGKEREKFWGPVKKKQNTLFKFRCFFFLAFITDVFIIYYSN